MGDNRFVFPDRAAAREFGFFEHEINAGVTEYGWEIVILPPRREQPADGGGDLRPVENDEIAVWDRVCENIARGFLKGREEQPLVEFDDIFQVARIKVFRLLQRGSYPQARPHGDDEQSLAFRTAIANAIRDYLRKLNRWHSEHERALDALRWLRRDEASLDPEELVAALHLRAEIEKLPPRLREVVELHGIQDMRQSDVADLVGCDQSTVHRRWKEALRWLSRTL